MSFTFKKEERLCSKKQIDELFDKGNSFSHYPFVVYYLEYSKLTSDFPVQVLITVSKKKIRKAVKRNLIKRRIKESYRHLKPILYQKLSEYSLNYLLAIVYIAPKPVSYHEIHTALENTINKLLLKIEINQTPTTPDHENY